MAFFSDSPPPQLLHEDLLVPWQTRILQPSKPLDLNFLKRLLSAKPQHRPEEQPLLENSGASSIVRMNQKRLKAFQMVHLQCLNKGRIELLAVTPICIYLVTKLLHYVSSILHDKVL